MRHSRAFDVILPFLKPVEDLIRDPEISEIMVNAGGRVWIEREGRIHRADGIAVGERALRNACRNIARVLGGDIGEESPLLDARLPDGSRVAAAFPPCSPGGAVLTIRKFPARPIDMDRLVELGALPRGVAEALRACVADERLNILISGGTATGKTTLLNALAGFIPPEERLIVIEDTAEIRLEAPNLLRFEARPGKPGVGIGDLLRASLRHRPDRIILGEARGGEAFELLQILNTGHSGTLSCIHANSARQALSRFAACVLQSGVALPYEAIRRLIAESLHLVAHLRRLPGGRRVLAELASVEGLSEGGGYRLEYFPLPERSGAKAGGDEPP